MRIFAALGLIYLVVILLYFPILNTFFSQDDFFHFIVSHNSGIQTMMATTFILLSLINYHFYLNNKKLKYLLLTFFAFLAGLGSHEIAIVIPILLLGLSWVEKSFKEALGQIQKLWPFLAVAVAFILLDWKVIGFSKSEIQYQTVVSLKSILNSLMWYSGWALGLPESLVDFVLPGFRLNPTLMRYWGGFYGLIFPALGFALTIILITLALGITKAQKKLNPKIVFLSIWFLAGLLPVIFLPSHKSSHYLIPVLPAFWGILIIGLRQLQKRFPYIYCLSLFWF